MKTAVCNELFGTMDFARTCDLLADHGFNGIEIAPFTLARESGVPSASAIRGARNAIESSGLRFAGLHWLLAKPDGLHITANDETVRRRSWEHLETLLNVAGEFGGGNLILGSPNQRSFQGIDHTEATVRLIDGFRHVADVAAGNSSRLLLEALPHTATNLVNTIEEALDVVSHVGHPAIGTMFDFHNVGDEQESWEALVQRYAGEFQHVHLNTMEGGYPTEENVGEYRPAMRAISESGYGGWISLEIFTEPESPAQVLRDTRRFLDSVLKE